MTRDELEFSISQYIDGTLGARERDVLDERLATDVEARAIFAEYQSLQTVLAAAPMPEMDWDALASRISGAVAEADEPAQSYTIGRWLWPARLAVAASVVLAAGIGFTLMKPNGTANPGSGIAPVPTPIVRVDGIPTGVNVAVVVSDEPIRIAIGPSPEAAKQPIFVRYDDTVVRRPSKAVIVSAAPVAQDNSLTSPF